MAKEPKRGLLRRELFERVGALFIGGATALYFDVASADDGPVVDIPVVAAKTAEEAEEVVSAAIGDFFPSAFINNPELLNPDGTAKLGYRIGGNILTEYQRNQTNWGPVRTQEFEYQGHSAQLFANALVVENEAGISLVPVIKTLQDQGLDSWLNEYGFYEPNVPIWKAVVASNQFVPAEALVPIGRKIDQRTLALITQKNRSLAITNLDPFFSLTFDQPDYIARLLDITGDKAKVNINIVSSELEIPSALGRWSDGQDPKRPWTINIIGGVVMQQLIMQSANGQDFDFWVSVPGLHLSNLGWDPVSFREALLRVEEKTAEAIQSRLIPLQVTKQPEYRWGPTSESSSYLPQDKVAAYQTLIADMRKSGIIIFNIDQCDAQTCPA